MIELIKIRETRWEIVRRDELGRICDVLVVDTIEDNFRPEIKKRIKRQMYDELRMWRAEER